MNINKNYLQLKDSYLFSTIAKKVNSYKEEHKDAKIIRLGIGDVTLPLPEVCVLAMEKATKEMGDAKTFRGYGEEQGYQFLREAIANYYKGHGVLLSADEIFVSDGAKSDLGNILDIFGEDNKVLVPNPVYPVYVDTNVMAGRSVEFMEGGEFNDFLPMPNLSQKADIIYLCSPNNPTGAVYSRAQLKEWVDYALAQNAVILFDAAYEAFITEDLPRSIYEIEGANKCAIEFNSFSKKAGFTGTRCGYTIVPKTLVYEDTALNKLWLRRQTTKFNGVSYIVQRGAEAVFTKEGEEQCSKNIEYYLENAKILGECLDSLNIKYYGGKNSPYIWLKCPNGMKSWDYFEYLLNELNLVGTPGVGFGSAGEGYFRLTAFGKREDVIEAVSRLKKGSIN